MGRCPVSKHWDAVKRSSDLDLTQRGDVPELDWGAVAGPVMAGASVDCIYILLVTRGSAGSTVSLHGARVVRMVLIMLWMLFLRAMLMPPAH